MYEKILVANDGSDGAARAFATALTLSKRLKSELHMISVEELSRFPASIDEVVEEEELALHQFVPVVEQAEREAKRQRIRFKTHIVAGHPVPAIVDYIKGQHFDLLIVGYMGHSALYNRMIGSTTDRLVELAPCPVLVVK